ncbi:MAG TPA: ATP-binding protein [Thermoanaerobaculia bacterium]|nr:ATP-binding protein [Thermoanaerobaculia bacterium]
MSNDFSNDFGDSFSKRAEDGERQKRARAYKIATVEIPVLRCLGSAFLSLGVYLNNRFLLQTASNAGWLRVTIILAAYCAVSWPLLVMLFGRVKTDLSLAFLVLDLPIWTLAVYYSGAERSWLFFILFLHVADQAQVRFRRALGFVMFGTFCYALMLLWVVTVDGRPVPDGIALAKIAFVFAGGLYVALASRGVDKRRGHLANVIRMSRELIRKLEAQSIELGASRRRAEEGSAAKSEFLANMSHEMRTPLHGIIGMLQLAIDTETSIERARQLEMARRSAETLLATIGDILDFSKIEARRLELEPVYFSVRQLITDTLKTLGITAAEKGLTLAFAVSPEVPDRLWGDPLRIRQIVVNLVGNALKFTNRGEVVVRVSCEVMSIDRVTIGFEVRDTGVGIDSSRRHVIFDPFAQADSSHSRRYGGSGLGLAIVSRLLEAMGGVVTFESEQGKGSTFRFVLPMPCEPVGTAPPSEWETALSGTRVLLIEPNATTRAIIAGTLRAHGMVPESYATLDRALQPSIRAAYACVVADANILATTPWMPPVPVVRITSPLAPSYHAGVVVTRPIGERELLDAIGVALGVTERTMTYTLERRPEIARPLRVLVVDDNVVNQEFAAEAVRRLGHFVTTAESGAEALEILARRTFDVVLLDVQMPGIDGLEVVRRYRTTERGIRTPIVAVTAHSTREDGERCIDAGFDTVLTKPATQSSLGAIIREVTGVMAAAPAPAGPADAILDAVGGNVRLLARVRDAFAMQTPRLLAALRDAVTACDGELLFQTAHTLKGAISNFDVPEAIAATVQLERAGKAADFERAGELLPDLEAAIHDLEERIEAALG